MKSRFTRLVHSPALVRLLAFLAVLACFWLPIAAAIALFVRDPNTVTILTMSLLFVGFLMLARFWGRWLYGDRHIFRTYGLTLTRQNGLDLLAGLSLGLVSLLLLFLVQAQLGWVAWRSISQAALAKVVLEGSLTGLGTGLAEELVFRGWVLDELERDYSPATALWASSLIFAGLHFLKPIPEMIRTFPQFPGLVLLGLALVWAKRSSGHLSRSGRLGFPIGLHAGLVWGYYIIAVGNLVTYTQHVPEWVTGVDQNPLAGAMGLIFLAGLAGLMKWRSGWAS